MNFPVDHDMHCHTFLSSCSSDPEQTPSALLTHALSHGYTLQCVTDHLWDNLVPGASRWYTPQDIAHVTAALPLPRHDKVRMVFGCETEFTGDRLGLAPEHFDLFGFIVIPPNHFHMKGFVRPRSCDSEEKAAALLTDRLDRLASMDLPWYKVGIAHITCSLVFSEGNQYQVYDSVDEKRYRSIMRRFSHQGAGIEINLSSFDPLWRQHESSMLRLYRIAAEEGCKFYLASDAHHPQELDTIPDRAPEVLDALGLTAAEVFTLR